MSLLARDGTLVACGFTADLDRLQSYLDAGLLSATRRTVRDLGPVTKAFDAYFDGDVAALDLITADQPGTPLQRRAWAAMRAVPPGQTITYGQLAAAAGNPAAVRAAGSACARNRLAPVVCCHRVVPSAGGVGNYGYGPPVKQWLLEHERRHSVPRLALDPDA